MSKYFQKLEQDLGPYRQRVLQHPIYEFVNRPERLRLFMEHHVVAVWDFMSVLKTLQRSLTGISSPWAPSANPHATRLINEIVLAEESDQCPDGTYLSHFEIYLRAMNELGANTDPMISFLEMLPRNANYQLAMKTLSMSDLPESAISFGKSTLDSAADDLVVAAANFLLGREDLVPDMFSRFLPQISQESCPMFHFYLQRHIEIDGEEHGPMARQLLSYICGEDEHRWEQAFYSARKALIQRAELWDGVLASASRQQHNTRSYQSHIIN